jgi:hypothetical protein
MVADPPESDDELARRNDAGLSAFVGHIAPETRAPDREDIVQDTWVKALMQLRSAPGCTPSLGTSSGTDGDERNETEFALPGSPAWRLAPHRALTRSPSVFSKATR